MSDFSKCCICLDQFTSPVTLPCGHWFCLGCIGEYWRLHWSYQCPICKAWFPIRPKLETDHKLRAGAQTSEDTVPLTAGEVTCDVCPAKHRAVKSCLMCLSSYCVAHLEPHYRDAALGRHRLVSVLKNLDDSVCELHGRQVDRFCRSDQTCICVMCAQADHRGHRIVAIGREAMRKKVKLKRRMMKLMQIIQETLSKAENVKLSVDLGGGTGENRLAAWTQAEGLIKELEQEITELQGKYTELEQLSRTEDHLHFLQVCVMALASIGIIDFYTPLHPKDVRKTLLQELWDKFVLR